MSDPAKARADYEALNELIVNCPDFDRLEALLGGFNLFQVLKFEHGEIRHSNVLAWILDPEESHGLGATFLKKWLMRTIHESPEHMETPVSPVDIDGWQLLEVEVRREWKNIDLLLILTFEDKQQWVISIENKINSVQHSNQLRRYRQYVEAHFPGVARRIFIFLTKSEETPEDEAYLTASYTQVHQALKECLQTRSHAVGEEPKVLLQNYLRLLEEKFMDDSEIARTALRIYRQHRRALDVIFEHRPDNLRMASDRVRTLLAENAASLGFIMESTSKAYIRFLPREWNHRGNTFGSAWAGTNRTVLIELNLCGKKPVLYAISGKAPDAWIDPVWQRAALAPFNRPKRNSLLRPKMWCSLHMAAPAKISIDEDIVDSGDTAQKIFDWVRASYLGSDFQEVIKIIAAEMPALESAFSRAAP